MASFRSGGFARPDRGQARQRRSDLRRCTRDPPIGAACDRLIRWSTVTQNGGDLRELLRGGRPGSVGVHRYDGRMVLALHDGDAGVVNAPG
jgi:hypothetical protein